MADPCDVRYSTGAENDVSGLRAFNAEVVVVGVEQRLRHWPSPESRSRIKRMLPPLRGQFGPRLGEHRVYYDVDEVKRVVSIVRALFKGTGTTPDEQS